MKNNLSTVSGRETKHQPQSDLYVQYRDDFPFIFSAHLQPVWRAPVCALCLGILWIKGLELISLFMTGQEKSKR